MHVSDTRSGVLKTVNLNEGSKFHLNDLGTLGIFHAKKKKFLAPGDLPISKLHPGSYQIF